MRQMVQDGEAASLVPERVWQETERALGESRPEVFFEVLRACGALAVIFPEVDKLFGVPQPPQWHPEIDTGVHVMLCLQRAVALQAPVTVRFAVLAHDLGKGATPQDHWPRHIMHESRGLPLVDALCSRLKVPAAHRELARMVCAQHTNVHRALELRPETVLKLLGECDAFRRPERFSEMLLACQCDAQGRTGLEEKPYPQRAYLERARELAAAVALNESERAGLEGQAIARALQARRQQVLEEYKRASCGTAP
jgi:tRNA nucleotidyltransferase (CCA-adding enzyme)